MAWFLVPRNEVHQSTLMVEAETAAEAFAAVHENGQGTEVALEYHHTPEKDDQPEVEFVEELTRPQAYRRACEALQKRRADDAVQYLVNELGQG